MERKISKTKLCIYLLLVALTAIYGYFSFTVCINDVASRTMPQVIRAMTQVARLLPQLEENEQAVREVYDNLEECHRKIYQNDDDALEEIKNSEENAETIIDHTLSWMNRVTMLRVGQRGHVIVVSQYDDTILAHPDEQFVGEVLHPIGNVDMDSIPDISEIENGQTSYGFYTYFPTSFFKEKISPARLYAAADAGIYGAAFTYKDTYVLCGITFFEAVVFVYVRSFFNTLFFFLIAWVIVRYIGFSLIWRKDDRNEFRRKLITYSIFAVLMLFAVTWYYQTMMDMTGDLATMNEHARVAVDNLNTYREYSKELSKWLDDQYLEQCRLAADLVNRRGKENLTRQDLAKYAEELGVRYIYVYDRKGKVLVTNSPYDHLRISDNEEDPSYAFRPLLDGREYVIQEPLKDAMSGEKIQYIGVSLRDEEDLADGFVQIAVDPALRDRVLEPINVQTVLDNLVIGLPEYAMAIDKDTKQIVATTGLGFEKENVEELGIDLENLKKDYNGLFEINDKTYYASVSESEDLYLMPLAVSTDKMIALTTALILTVVSILAFFLLVITGLFAYKRVLTIKEAEIESADDTEKSEKKEGDKEDIFDSLKTVFSVQDKYGFDSRWKKRSSIPVEQQTPEMRTGKIIYYILLLFSIFLILLYIFMDPSTKMAGLGGFSFLFLADWPKGFNLFSVSYCLFLLCVLYVYQEVLNQILYRIAKVSNLKNETILLLLRNALKYACALIFLYMGLAKFGINTKALWASVGVLSLMVGLGAKDLINDIIAGLFIIFEGTYKIGDFVTVGSWWGTVEEIGLRYTKIAWYAETKTINNSSMRDIINAVGDVAREIVKFPIHYETDLLEVEELLKRELPEMAKNIKGLTKVPVYQGVQSFEDNCIMLRIAVFCDSYYRRSARRAMIREIKLLFDREHIYVPHSRVILMQDKEEEPPCIYAPENTETVAEETGRPSADK